MTEETVNRLAQYYDLDFTDPIPYRDGYILSDRNTAVHKLPCSLLLKKTELSVDRITFNHLAKAHLARQGFTRTDQYIATKNHLPCVTLEEDTYIITTKINGTEAYFENIHDTGKAAVALAGMHVASIGGSYNLEQFAFAVKDLGNLTNLFRHRVNELKKFRRMAAKGKSFFDYEYTKNAGYFIEDGERALEDLENSKYNELVAKTLADQSLCHHDFTSHNVVFSDGITYLTGFDNCCIEIKEYDLANFIRRKMRRTGWSLPDAKNMIDNYRSVCKLSEEELEVLRIILRFPQKLWRVVNKFYNSRRSWCERSCLEKMRDVLDEKEPLHLFLDNFDVIY